VISQLDRIEAMLKELVPLEHWFVAKCTSPGYQWIPWFGPYLTEQDAKAKRDSIIHLGVFDVFRESKLVEKRIRELGVARPEDDQA
jgi:hypothetical protein